MGWFDEQITLRKQADREAFEDSCLYIVGSVMGQRLTAALHDTRELATDAIGGILNYYRVKMAEVPERIQTTEEVLEFLLRPYGIMTREVRLQKDWRKDATSPMLTTTEKDGKVVALIPNEFSGYRYLDPDSGRMKLVDAEAEKLFSEDALVFYKPFPTRKLTVGDIWRYIAENIGRGSLVSYLIFALVATLCCMLLPYLTQSLFSDVTVSGKPTAFAAIAIFMICASLSTILFEVVQDLFLRKIALRLNMNIESATMMRILSMPGAFFKKYASGDLANRVQYMNLLVDQLISMGFGVAIPAVFSLLYIVQILSLAPALAMPALIVTLLVLLITVLTVIARAKVNRRQMELASKEMGLGYEFISGIEKIKLAGAERRAFAKWGRSYSAQASCLYDPPLFVKIGTVLTTAVSLAGTLVIYYAAIRSEVSVAQYYAFHMAYGMVNATFAELAIIAVSVSQIGPILSMVRPILETEPEISAEKPVIERLSGGVELNNVLFRYKEDMPPVLDNISLKIRSGQYVAIVGKTGCGKSTLMRILLGFETPQKGAVYYDGKDLRNIDLKSLRSKIGTVMQNGSLFVGDLYSNIVISAPSLDLDAAWEAAEIAGIADDIRAMPMGMFTMVSEGGSGFSGGQKQRLMIARAVAPKPRILMFDEATSALDNVTQKQVSDALDGLKCTRIVIAHRLSTIRNCDRIVVLDEGHIVEDGTYDELIEKRGYFAELVSRQQVNPV